METIKGEGDDEKRVNINKFPNDSTETADITEADKERKIKGMGADGNEEKEGLEDLNKETASMPLRQNKDMQTIFLDTTKYEGKGYVLEMNPRILDTQTIGVDKITETGKCLIRKTGNLPPEDKLIVTTTVSKMAEEECSCTQEAPEVPYENTNQTSNNTKTMDYTTDLEMVHILSKGSDVSRTEVYWQTGTVDTAANANQAVQVENQDNSQMFSYNMEEPNKEINVRRIEINEQEVECGINEKSERIIPCLKSFSGGTTGEIFDEDINAGIKINKGYCHIGNANKIKEHVDNDVMMADGPTVVDKETEFCDGYISCGTQPEKVTANNISVHDTDIKMSEPDGGDATDKISEVNVEIRPSGMIPEESLKNRMPFSKEPSVNEVISDEKVADRQAKEGIRTSDQLVKKEHRNSLTSKSKMADRLLETEGKNSDNSIENESVRIVTQMNHVTEHAGDTLQEIEDGEIVEETENDVRLKETDKKNIRQSQADNITPTESDLRCRLGRKAKESGIKGSFETNHKGKSVNPKPNKRLGNDSKKSKIGHKDISYYDWDARPSMPNDKIGKCMSTEKRRELINYGDTCFILVDVVEEEDEQNVTRATAKDEDVGEQKETCKEGSVVGDTRICKIKSSLNDDLRKFIDDRKQEANKQMSARHNADENIMAKSHRKRAHGSNERHTNNHKRLKAVHDKHSPKTENERCLYEQDRSNKHTSLSRSHSKQKAYQRTLKDSKTDNHFNRKSENQYKKHAIKADNWEQSNRGAASYNIEKILSECRYRSYKNCNQNGLDFDGVRDKRSKLSSHRETHFKEKTLREDKYASSERNRDFDCLRRKGKRTEHDEYSADSDKDVPFLSNKGRITEYREYSAEPERDVPSLNSVGRRTEHGEYLLESERYKDTKIQVGKMSSICERQGRLCPKEISQSALTQDPQSLPSNEFRQRHEESDTYMMTDEKKDIRTLETMSLSYASHRRSLSQHRKRYLDKENETENQYHAHKRLRKNQRDIYSQDNADRMGSQAKSIDIQNAMERIYFGSIEDVGTRNVNSYNSNTHEERGTYSHTTDSRWDFDDTDYENKSEQRPDRRTVLRDTETRLFENGEPVSRGQSTVSKETRTELFENGKPILRDQRSVLAETRSELFKNGEPVLRDQRRDHTITRSEIFENDEGIPRDSRTVPRETRSEIFEYGEAILRDFRTVPRETKTGLFENSILFLRDQRTGSRETKEVFFDNNEPAYREANTYVDDGLLNLSSNGSHEKMLGSPSSIYETESTPNGSLYLLSSDFRKSSRDLREQFQFNRSEDRRIERERNEERNNTNYQVTTQPHRVCTGMFGENAPVSIQVRSFLHIVGVPRPTEDMQAFVQTPSDKAGPSHSTEDSQLLTTEYLKYQTEDFRTDIITKIHRALANKKLNNVSPASVRSKLERQHILHNKFGTDDDLLYLIKKYDDKFIVRPVCGQDLISVKSDIKICPVYTNNQNKKHTCSDLHICKYYILNQCNSCNCKFGHDLNTEQNQIALKMKGLDGIKASSVRFVMKNIDSRNVSTTPLVCKFYNNTGGCKQERRCTFLHLCLHFLTEDCKFANCNRSHDFRDEQPLAVLKRHGIQPDIVDDVKIKELIKETLSGDRIKLKRDLTTVAENGTAKPGRASYKCPFPTSSIEDDPEQTSGDSIDSIESIQSNGSSSDDSGRQLDFIPLNAKPVERYWKKSKRS